MATDPRVALVTAAAGAGIGAAVARRLAQDGLDVVVTDAHERRCREFAGALTDEVGREVSGYHLDVTDHDQVCAVISEVAARQGPARRPGQQRGLVEDRAGCRDVAGYGGLQAHLRDHRRCRRVSGLQPVHIRRTAGPMRRRRPLPSLGAVRRRRRDRRLPGRPGPAPRRLVFQAGGPPGRRRRRRCRGNRGDTARGLRPRCESRRTGPRGMGGDIRSARAGRGGRAPRPPASWSVSVDPVSRAVLDGGRAARSGCSHGGPFRPGAVPREGGPLLL